MQTQHNPARHSTYARRANKYIKVVVQIIFTVRLIVVKLFTSAGLW